MSDVVQASGPLHLSDLAEVAAAALLLYEYIVTLPEEINCIWRRKMTVTALLLLTSRWLMLCTVFATIFDLAGINCASTGLTMVILTAISYFPVTLSFALRVFALWPDKRALAGVVFTLGLAPVITNGIRPSVFIYSDSYIGGYGLGCYFLLKPSEVDNYHLDYTICDFVAQGAMLTQEILVIGLTWARTYRQWREAQHIGVPVSITTCILRDGTTYFVIMFVLNVTQMAIFSPSKGEIIGGIMNTMPLVLTSRFILNLRQLSEPSEERSFRQPWSSSIFRVSPGTLGNISEPLDLGEYNAYEDNDGEAASEGVENVNCIKEVAKTDDTNHPVPAESAA